MKPDDIQKKIVRIRQFPLPEPGVGRFKANLTKGGGWRLLSRIKEPGVTGTITNKPVLRKF